MFSIRSALFVAATAFAAFTSAAPTLPAPGDVVNSITNSPALAAVNAPITGNNVLNGNKVNVLDTRQGTTAVVSADAIVAARDEQCSTCNTLDGIFVFVKAEVDVLTGKCNDAVKAGITIDVALSLIAEVKALVVKITALVQAIVKVDVDVNALIGVDVHVCVDAIVSVIVALLACIDVVVKACIDIKIDVTAILALVAEVVALVVALLKIILAISANLSVVLCAALAIAIKVIACIDIKVIVSLVLSVIAGIKL